MEANKTELIGAYKDAEDFYKKVYTVSLDNWDLKQVFKFADNYASEVLFGKLEKLQSELSELKEKRNSEWAVNGNELVTIHHTPLENNDENNLFEENGQ